VHVKTLGVMQWRQDRPALRSKSAEDVYEEREREKQREMAL
jgi:hypothetical protein